MTSPSPLLSPAYPQNRDHRKVRHRGSEDLPTGARSRHEDIHPRAPDRVHSSRARPGLCRYCCRGRNSGAYDTDGTGTTKRRSSAQRTRKGARARERSIQWAYDTFEGAVSVGHQSASVAIELIRNTWDRSSTSTILYFAITLLVLSNLWTLVLVGKREEAGRRKEMRRTEEREKWVQGIVTALWEELGTRCGSSAWHFTPASLFSSQQQSIPMNVHLPESWREEVAELMGALNAVEERAQLIRRSLADLD
jgi:hypothetical protein